MDWRRVFEVDPCAWHAGTLSILDHETVICKITSCGFRVNVIYDLKCHSLREMISATMTAHCMGIDITGKPCFCAELLAHKSTRNR